MSQTLTINNFGSRNIIETSKLDADAPVASTALVLQYSDNLSTDNYLLLGTPGSEDGEIISITGVTDAQNIAVSQTTKYHSRFDDVARLFGNQLRIYRAPYVQGVAPTVDDFVLLDIVAIDQDQKSTQYTDPAGGDAYWYTYTYYNETTTEESDIVPANAMRGGDDGYCSIEDVRKAAGLSQNRWVTDADVDLARRAAMQEINGKLTGLYQVPFTAPINPRIRDICKRLAAGLLLTSPDAGNFSMSALYNEGKDKLAAARADLDLLDTRTEILTDETGTPITLPTTTTGFQGWPNDETATAAPEDGGGERMFKVTDRY